jgi:hypothetical protein
MSSSLYRLLLVSCVLAALFAPSLRAADAITTTTAKKLKPLDVLVPTREFSIVHVDDTHFCGWPANEGIWHWGDEILVGFEMGNYEGKKDAHSINWNQPPQTRLARSMDGGKTWTVDPKQHFAPPEYIGDPKKWGVITPERYKKLTAPIDFTSSDTILKFRGQEFYYSSNRGHAWHGPFKLPDFDQAPLCARTDYLINGPRSAIAFLQGTEPNGACGRVFAAETHDGGLTWQHLGWITPHVPTAPEVAVDQNYTIMPSTARLNATTYVSAIRSRLGKKKWTDVFRSTDAGRTWALLSTPEQGGVNPSSMVILKDGRLCITYGCRDFPFGIRARISEDGGATWGKIISIRDDAATWDMGYPRSVVRPDGKVITINYMATAQHPQQHIEATVWDPLDLKPDQLIRTR